MGDDDQHDLAPDVGEPQRTCYRGRDEHGAEGGVLEQASQRAAHADQLHDPIEIFSIVDGVLIDRVSVCVGVGLSLGLGLGIGLHVGRAGVSDVLLVAPTACFVWTSIWRRCGLCGIGAKPDKRRFRGHVSDNVFIVLRHLYRLVRKGR